MDDITIRPKKTVDVYRDTPIRYLGYANEVGEAFRSIIGSKWVLASYGVATAYVFADTSDKSIEIYKANELDPKQIRKTIYTASDTLIWQMIASVMVPGFTINRVCATVNYLLEKNTKLSKNPRQWLVTSIGLLTIPFIIKPIDHMTDRFLDESIRKLRPT